MPQAGAERDKWNAEENKKKMEMAKARVAKLSADAAKPDQARAALEEADASATRVVTHAHTVVSCVPLNSNALTSKPLRLNRLLLRRAWKY